MSTIKRINAVFIYAADIKTMKSFYQETLELGAPKVDTDLWVEFELEGANLALHQGDPRAIEKQDASKNSVKFCLETQDIQAAYEKLSSMGVHFTFEPRKDFGSLLAEMKDPEGNLIRVIQFV